MNRHPGRRIKKSDAEGCGRVGGNSAVKRTLTRRFAVPLSLRERDWGEDVLFCGRKGRPWGEMRTG